jgi:DNA-binding MarR family transcriptional regulator
MAQSFTEDQIVDAAGKLDQDEFTREDIATQLGVEKADVKQAFNKAKRKELIEKTRDDEDNTGHFKLAG